MSLPLPLAWLQELLAPEFCVLCGQPRGAVPWWRPPTDLLQACGREDPHICLSCWEDLLAQDPARAWLAYEPGRKVLLDSAQHTNPQLVRLVSAWKYGGLRGVSLPLTALLARDLPPRAGIVLPIPLHGRRQRWRGFNQAAVLARGLATLRELQFRDDILRRRRATAQQARQPDAVARARNLAGAFGARPAEDHRPPVYVVDDIVTSGATAAAALLCLAAAGWQVAGVLCLGLAMPGAAETPLDG